MATTVKQWPDGGSLTIQYDGQGDGEIIVTSDPNTVYEARSMEFTVKTADGSVSITRTIQQAARQHIDISAAVVTASNQTYSGVAKTPTPTVTLDGSTVPSSGYDVSYSNNTNAGTATITVTGKGEYAGTATGTFTINKATPSYTAPATRSLTYNGSSQYLTTLGSTSHGTIYYSTDGVNWYTSRRTATTAGSYSCYWKLVGDSNHTDISSTYIGTTSIAKASRTLSFADTYMVLNTSSTGTKTATPSAGSSDGAITYGISNTTYATINSSTGAVTAKTSDGSVIVTATIAEGTNYLSASASYTLYVFATTHNYSYSGSAKNVTLPPGTYQFQCWGAQGGSNGANSTYGITAKAGGKGGYSVGQLTTVQALTIQVLVGGQGSASAAGYNGGGSTTGTSQYNSGYTFGYSKMGGGGGASDIRLSDGALLSRMIVAGGGSGGSCGYVRTTSETSTNIFPTSQSGWEQGSISYDSLIDTNYRCRTKNYIDISSAKTLKIIPQTVGYINSIEVEYFDSNHKWIGWSDWKTSTSTVTPTSGAYYAKIVVGSSNGHCSPSEAYRAGSVIMYYDVTTTDVVGQTGYAGGGTNGVGYSSSYYGKQNAAGSGGSFGQGANQTISNYRHCSGAGGGGWYGGGGGSYSDSSMSYIYYMGGGSGFVNTSASAGNRPSGYTGLELDSGTTYAGNTSFPSTGGSTETGHSGNGYVRITRL